MSDLRMPAMAEIAKTSEGLRDALFDEINGLRTGTTTVQRAKTVATLASRIIESLRAQVAIQRMIEGKAKNVSLGTSGSTVDSAAAEGAPAQ